MAFLALLLTALLLFSSCGSSSYVVDNYGSAGPSADGSTSEKESGADSIVTETIAPSSERKIIKTANLSAESATYDDFLTSLSTAVQNAGGYYASASYSGKAENKNRFANLTIRVPADRFDAFRAEVEGFATVLSYSETMDDVTSAYVDIESRIAVLEAEEKALLAILEKTETVSDAITVRKSLTDVQSDLAALRAQKASYDERIDYSTLHLSVREVERERLAAGSDGFFAKLGDTFMESVSAIGSALRAFAIWFLGNIVAIALVAAIGVGTVFFIRWLVRKKRVKKQKADSIATDEPQEPKA